VKLKIPLTPLDFSWNCGILVGSGLHAQAPSGAFFISVQKSKPKPKPFIIKYLQVKARFIGRVGRDSATLIIIIDLQVALPVSRLV
jgi:hypothetical protein